ncbi:F-box domain [Arabidopsis thaliana x Arabidopsis arenosa]|uniref:F-box domain n=1 Tax=Arabidopsis thaliana x Arabidopsis arenosa TaxID=1240361 RepID=A0A8T2C8J5_9BRAS|nr:F-box domain [Arabidopsis thaliana x Arabidopsis arenosa]
MTHKQNSMAVHGENRDGASASVRVLNHRSEDLDTISSLPDVILQQILSLIQTKYAIRTSILSKRWRYVWSETPSLYFDDFYKLDADSIDKTLALYRARKIMTFQLCATSVVNLPYNEWIEFAMSRNVEHLFLNFGFLKYNFPDSFSWKSLKTLSLRCCNLSDESFAKILSGCPILESLTLYSCDELMVLDLTKSPSLKILEIHPNIWDSGPTHIVAPHIHCLTLTLKNSQLSCTFVDVSSLTEAKLDICSCALEDMNVDFLQDMVLKILDKLQNVDKLTFGENFLKILSLAEVRGVPFPMFKAKALTLETMISQYVTPGILRLLQNSPELKKLTLHTMDCETDTIPDKDVSNYLCGLNLNHCWIFGNVFHWNVESKHVASFMELMIKTTKALEKMFIRLESYLDGRDFEELLEMVPMLSQNNNVSIEFSSISAWR